MLRRIRRLASFLALCAIVALAVSAWQVFVPEGGVEGSDRTPVDEGHGFYSDLDLTGDDLGLFSGSITLFNESPGYQDGFVVVDVFDGQQNVGTLRGDIAMKPDSEASVELLSSDRYVDWTDARVRVRGLPAG